MEFVVKSYKGDNARQFINEIADLRIRIFRDFPYMYDGSLKYEIKYLERYFSAPDATVFLLFYGANIIGLSTCIPLAQEVKFVRKPFHDMGLDVDKYFYFGESILEKTYRGRGLGKLFFQYREEEALRYPSIQNACFCAVVRHENHPAKPDSYFSLEGFWQKLGYIKQPELVAQMHWKETGQKEETTQDLVFWTKKLR